MNNNFKDNRHPAQQVSGPNKFLHIAMQTKVPLDIYFNDGEVLKSCVIMELDTFNLLVRVVDLNKASVAEQAVITRSSIKKISFQGAKQP
jgi:hypothetical protein